MHIPMAQGRSTKTISTIEWIRTSRLSIKKSLSAACRPSISPGGRACQKGRTPPDKMISREIILLRCRARWYQRTTYMTKPESDACPANCSVPPVDIASAPAKKAEHLSRASTPRNISTVWRVWVIEGNSDPTLVGSS